MKIKNKKIIAQLALLAAAMIWGGGFVVVKNSLASVSPSWMIAMRFTLAAIGLTIIFFRRMKGVRRADLLCGLVLGGLLYAAYAAQTYGLAHTTAGNNAFITTVYVILVPFFYWAVKKKRPDRYNIIAAVLCMAGIGLLSLHGGLTVNIGDLLTLLCGVFLAAHITAVSIYTKKHDLIRLTVLQFAFTAAIAWAVALIFEPFSAGFTARGVGEILYLGMISTMLALLLQNVGQKYTAPAPASLIMCTEAVFGIVFARIFLGEVVTLRAIGGGGLILLSVVLSETKLSFLCRKGSKAGVGSS